MATAPLKSQPLHNFSLSQLSWGHQKNHVHRRPSSDTTIPAPSHHHHRRPSPSEQQESHGGDRDANRFSISSCSSQKAVVEREEEETGKEKKPWNLRPRKAVLGISGNGGAELTGTAALPPALPKSTRLRGDVEGQKEVEERKDLWVALCREEVEEDVYAMTGSRPGRRPKKRPKTVQKQLDNLFPGLYLTGITPDSYRVDDAPR